ncbi:hypothetical protein BN1049_00417 [Pseudomonas saudimassiliensis]|uniref:Uncharacterized protein n=1 Tax=Pseudomonas saudimassiliensis TaxID=1461581 RepID=A0A078M253_9PSED|nr:hypothetical protein BN1049_00417 [Pseudomonas saudimassiliensis]CEF25515.1 hypothetical protein BN1049_00417 [Pseudomonas saudimassiliensis]
MSQLRGAEAEGRGFADCNQTPNSLYSLTGKSDPFGFFHEAKPRVIWV